MDCSKTIALTEEFYLSAVFVEAPQVDTSRAIIPAPRSIEQVITDAVNYFATVTTAKLRIELRNEIDSARGQLSAMRAERESMAQQRADLESECAAVAQARRMLAVELDRVQAIRNRTTDERDRYASGLCTPSRRRMTG